MIEKPQLRARRCRGRTGAPRRRRRSAAGQDVGDREAWVRRRGSRRRNRRWASTGSKPPWLNGLQRSSRHAASTSPRSMPYSRIACDRVGRARRLVLAAPRQRRRDHPLVGDDRREREPARSRRAALRRRATDFSTSSASAARTPSRPSRSASSRASGRATTTTSWSSGSASAERPERLAEQALDAVAVDGAADLARHRQAEARAVGRLAGGRARERVEDEEAVADRAALAVDALELRAAGQAPALRAPAGGARQAVHRGQTVSRLRPLARRRLSVRRPARVLMRARNPWVRARLRFLGW